jgi:hypothetical protein
MIPAVRPTVIRRKNMKMIHVVVVLAFLVTAAGAADEPLLPNDVNRILGRIRPKMPETEVEKIVQSYFPGAKATLGDWSGQTGYAEFKLNTRYLISVAEYNDPKDFNLRFVHADMILYVYDSEAKRKISVSPLAAHSAESSDLELSASISGESYLHLEITNRGDSEQTVLTDNFTIRSFGMSVNGRRLPSVDLRFCLLKIGTEKNPEERIYVPSLYKLAPVTLRKGETARAAVQLDKEFIAALKENPDKKITIRYRIDDAIAQRFSLWHGTLEETATGQSLLAK